MLPEYSGTGLLAHISCVKCGELDASSKYIPRNMITHDLGAGPFMKRECLNCGFTWKEKTLDGEGR
jgi:Zn ribbon nucleic-acid-binding protein